MARKCRANSGYESLLPQYLPTIKFTVRVMQVFRMQDLHAAVSKDRLDVGFEALPLLFGRGIASQRRYRILWVFPAVI